MKRIRISFSKRKFKRVKLLAGHNDDLAKLLGSNDELSVLRQRRKNSLGPVKLFQRVQDYASSLHIALKNKWLCDCQAPHYVRLQLNKRIDSSHRGSPSTAYLRARFSFDDAAYNRNSRSVHDTEIRVSEVTEQLTDYMVRQSVPNEDLARLRQQFEFQSLTVAASARLELKDGVLSSSMISQTETTDGSDGIQKRYDIHLGTGFSTFPHASNWLYHIEIPKRPSANPNSRFPFRSAKSRKQTRFEVGKLPSISVSSSNLNSPDEKKLQEVDDICATIHNWTLPRNEFPYLLDEQKRKHVLYPIDDHNPPSHAVETVTLEKLLKHQADNGQPVLAESCDTLTRQQRFTIAAILASSFLQLHSTPWLADSWSKKDITFIRASDGSRRPLIEYPYISQSFISSRTKTTPSHPLNTAYPSSADYDCRKCLFSLGVMLLELCFGEALEDQKLRKLYYGPDNRPNDRTDYCTAQAWQKKVQGECGDGLSEAVRRCIDCSFGPRPDLADKSFLAAVFAGVVEPVEEVLRCWPVPT